MVQIAFTDPHPWPESGQVEIAGQLYEIPISPEQTRRRAKGFLAGYITMLVTAGEPTCLIDEAPVWRVSARLVLPGVGEVGTLGAISIDAQTGEVIPLSSEVIAQMQDLAQTAPPITHHPQYQQAELAVSSY